LYHRHPYEAIGLLSVQDPWIRLSPVIVAKHTNARRSGASLPPWFTLVWEGGTFQWQDPRASHGIWTLYQGRGIFRIRGPQTSVMVRGSIQEAQLLRFQFSSLAGRWMAELHVSEGQSQGVLTLLQTLAERSLLPVGWTVRGGFQFDAHASGRRPPAVLANWMHGLDKATLTFTQDAHEKTPSGTSLALAGTLIYQ